MPQCPCGSAKAFNECCSPYLAGDEAPTAEALMRSRYSAFAVGDLNYLERTNTAKAARTFNRVDLEIALPEMEWLGFELHGMTGGRADDDAGTVKFTVRYRYKGREFSQIEDASFVRVDDRWLYDGGKIAPTSQPVRVEQIGRNDPCPCGSGRKYKKCCGR